MLKIHSIETLGTHEGPGIRLVLFLQGCLFRCLYCHNPDTWSLEGGAPLPHEDILSRVEKVRPYFGKTGGVTASGGEPLLQRVALGELFQRLKKLGVHTALDTNGFILDADTKTLLSHTDLVLLDVKHIDPQIHMQLTKSPNDTVIEFAAYCESIGKPMWLRYVLVPGITDQVQYLKKWSSHFKDYQSVQRVEILPYHTFGAYKYKQLGISYPLTGVTPPTKKQIKKALSIFSDYFKTVYVR